MKPSSIGIGFSHQSVPSLSKIAIRSAGGTKSGPPSVVTRATKSTIAARVAVSFQRSRAASSFRVGISSRLALEVEIRLAADVDPEAVDRAPGEAVRCRPGKSAVSGSPS